MADDYLSKGGKAAAGLLAAAVAVFVAGFCVRAVLFPDAQASSSKIDAIEAKVNKLDKNMARVMDRMGIAEEPELPPLRTSGPAR